MSVRNIWIPAIASVVCMAAVAGPSAKNVKPKAGVAILVNENNSHISIDMLDGERKGLKSHGLYELTPGSHTVRVRLYYVQGNREWSSYNYVDYTFEAVAGAVLQVVCEETGNGETARWRMRIIDVASGKEAVPVNPNVARADAEHKAQLALEAERDAKEFLEIKPKAERGDLESQYRLAMKYDRGEGTPADYAESVKWLQKAAERGHDMAQFYLGMDYYLGQGVEKDLVEAYVWLSLASADDESSSSNLLEGVRELLSPDQLEKAKVLLQKRQAEIKVRRATA